MVERNLAGLCANKIQSKYQKPCVILTKTWDKELNDYVYAGSARNYSMSEIQNFKDVCENTNVTNMTAGQMVALIHLFCLSAGFYFYK
jgi:single-stranded DNA-specific DHH superfamily exonuclease